VSIPCEVPDELTRFLRLDLPVRARQHDDIVRSWNELFLWDGTQIQMVGRGTKLLSLASEPVRALLDGFSIRCCEALMLPGPYALHHQSY